MGGQFELDAAYTYSSEEAVPIFSRQQILMNYSFSANRILPCQRGGTERSCAEIEMNSSADPEDTKRMIQFFFAKLTEDALLQTPVFRTLEIENAIKVVPEPSGLVPHTCTITNTIGGTVVVDGENQRVEQGDKTQVRCVYP